MERVTCAASITLPVAERSQAAEARRVAVECARSLGFDETLAGKIAIAVTEAGNNLANHAVRGEIQLSSFRDHRGPAFEFLSIDRGPGMDLKACLDDGYSTAGTAGTGLGAIQRLATVFDAWSDSNGTVLFARFEPQGSVPATFIIGAVRVPKPGQTVCGDAWAMRPISDGAGMAVMVADGLGHGQFAADASTQAVNTFLDLPWKGTVSSVGDLHAALHGSRGAAVGVAEIQPALQRIAFSGLGNISAAVFGSDAVQRLVSHNGTAGHQAARIAEFTYQWRVPAMLIMASDGISTHYSMDRYIGLQVHHPGVIAGVLYRDFARGNDDATIVVLKQARA